MIVFEKVFQPGVDYFQDFKDWLYATRLENRKG